jgi:hypothetical protein
MNYDFGCVTSPVEMTAQTGRHNLLPMSEAARVRFWRKEVLE